ncbi:hypothetical protein K1719_031253 [Acacia pycnantha]|nr:hypothetical protein K1719_045969 [Acacia pycnantha]KAI9086659.1 hypothetical protein K1719_031253 [Acacia pycnantha]
MFHSIPNADAVLMKWILHDWSDEDCMKILKNCKKCGYPYLHIAQLCKIGFPYPAATASERTWKCHQIQIL